MIGSIVGAAAGVAGGIIGGISASKARKKANKVLDQQEKDNEQWYKRKSGEDYTQSAEAQSALNRAREMADEQYKRAAGAAAVGGGTEESVALAKQGANDMVSDTMEGIATNATARKDAAEQQYLQKKENIANQRVSIYTQQAASAAQAGSQAMSAGMGVVGADMQSYLSNGKGLFETMFKKKGA